jgi:2-polyprenyl-3-methyl-5-hydroxy-6-metoxy-1,4-benzoquinol methylase
MMYREFFKNAVQEAEGFLSKKISEKARIEFGEKWLEKKPITSEEFLDFYENESYIDELADWHSRGTKIASVHKVVKVLLGSGARKVLDYGGGIGSDALTYNSLGLEVDYFDVNKQSIAFARWRFDKYGAKINVLSTQAEMGFYDVIVFTDVIGHVHDPFVFLKELSSHTNALLFTIDLGVHDDEHGGQPQHTDFSREDVFAYLRSLGFEKVKLPMAIPPQFWVRKGSK